MYVNFYVADRVLSDENKKQVQVTSATPTAVCASKQEKRC